MNRPPESSPSSPSSPSSMSNPPHPAVQALEKFAASTPLVTRCLVYLQWTTYLLSWFVPDPALSLALSNYPEFSIRHWEAYRLITSVLVNTRLADLVFVYWLVVPASTILERCFGSAKMAVLVGALTAWTNLLFVLLWLVGSAVMTGTFWTTQSTSSVWIVGFGLMSLEAMIMSSHQDGDHHDDGSHRSYRKICFLTVRAQHAPALLYVLTGILSLRYDLGCLVSLLLGYALGAHHHQHRPQDTNGGVRSIIGAFLDRITLNSLTISQLRRCEETGLLAPLVEFSRSSSRSSGGWIASHSATGIHAGKASRAGPTMGHGGPATNASVRMMSLAIHAKNLHHCSLLLNRYLTPFCLFALSSLVSTGTQMLPLFQMPARRAASSAAASASGGGGEGGICSEGGGRVLGGGGGGGGAASSLSAPRPRAVVASAPAAPSHEAARAARLQALDRTSNTSKRFNDCVPGTSPGDE
jgi:hypothetical protein